MCTFPYPYCPSRAGKPGRRAVKGSWAKRDMLQLGEILTFQALFLLRLIVLLVSVLYKNIWFLYLCVSPLIILMTPGLINGCGEHYINVPLHPAPAVLLLATSRAVNKLSRSFTMPWRRPFIGGSTNYAKQVFKCDN